MTKAVDVLMKMVDVTNARAKRLEEETSSTLDRFNTSLQNNRKLDILKEESKRKKSNQSLTDLLNLGKVRELAKDRRDPDLLRKVDSQIDALVGKSSAAPATSVPNPNTQASSFVDPGASGPAAPIPAASQPPQPFQVGQGLPAQFDEFGEEREEFKLAVKEKEANIQRSKEVMSQESKVGAQASREFLNQDLKIDNHLDSFYDFALRQKEITGLDPGPLSGVVAGPINAFLRSNEFQEGFQGSLIEVAAATARIAMPGTRAIRAISIFNKTVADRFDTIESGVQNSADSIRQGLVNDMASNIEVWVPGYGEMSVTEKSKARQELKDQAAEFEKLFVKESLKKVYMKGIQHGKHVLEERTIRKIEIDIPTFKTEAEGDKALDKGELYFVGGELKEAT